MSGANGSGASRSTGGGRRNLASSMFIDLTGDNDEDSEDSKKRNEKLKKKSNKSFIDLSISSDDEPSAPAKTPVLSKPQAEVKLSLNSPPNASAKPRTRVPKYQNGGIYSLLSGGESDDELRTKVSGSLSKKVDDNPKTDAMTRRSPSRSKSNSGGVASSVPLRQGTARKTVMVSHRKSSSGSFAPVTSHSTQNKINSAPSSARSTPGALGGHGILPKSGSILNLSHVIGQQPKSKATSLSTAGPSQLNISTAGKVPASNIPPVHLDSEKVATPRPQCPIASISLGIKESPVFARDAPSIIQIDRGRSGSQNDNESRAELDLHKKQSLFLESRLDGEAGCSRSIEKEDTNSNLLTREEVPRITRKVVERRAEDYIPARENARNTDKDDDAGNHDGNGKILSMVLQPDGNDNPDRTENEIIDYEFPSGTDSSKARKTPYKKKGNHGGARRGPAWEKQRHERNNATGGRSIDSEASDDEDDDIQPLPRRRRKRGQDTNQNLVSKPPSPRSASPILDAGKERCGQSESHMTLISKGKCLTLGGPSKIEYQGLSVDEMKRSLANLEETMTEDRGLSIRSILEKRRLRAQTAMKLDNLDEESPFASLKAADENAEGAVKLDIRTTRKDKIPTYVIPIVVGHGGVDRTPAYTHHINVIRNHLTGDDETLRYIPIVDTGNAIHNKKESAEKFVKDLNTAYTERNSDPREKERVSQIDRHLDDFLEGIGYDNCNRPALVRYYLGHESQRLSYPKEEEKFVLKTLGGPLTGELYKKMVLIVEEMTEAFGVDLDDVVLSQSRFKELVESSRAAQSCERSADRPSPPERLETVAQFTCLICLGAACTTHGEYNYLKINKDISSDDSSEVGSPAGRSFKKSDYEYVWDKLVMHYPDVRRKHNARDHSKKNENWHPEHWNTDKDTAKACSDECYRGRTIWTNYAWTQEEENELKNILLAVKPNKPCSLVDIVDKPCWQIYSKILDLEDQAPVNRSRALPKKQKIEPAEWYDPKAVPRNRGLKPGWQDDTTAHMHDKRVQPAPCVHDGPCRREMDCHCVIQNILCEHFCGCPDDCGRRFAGCSCHAEGLACASDTCICFQMNRECGEQCDSCGSLDRTRPQNRHKEGLFQNGCQNIALQRGVNKKLILGKSQLQGVGFGLFTAEPIKKGDFLHEYAGEVISENEANRRGVIYDRKYSSFLFDLNKEWIIDGARMGNKTRFINHAETEADGLNCIAKILLVHGEHRIEFRASRDIKIGEELFFNYGKKFAEIQGLDKKIGDGKGKMPQANQGVVTGEAALAELDGLSGRRGARREKAREIVEALEGGVSTKGKRGRPRGKASKKARVEPHLAVAGLSNPHGDQEDGEIDGDGDEMMMDIDPSLYPDIIQDSDVEDETFIGKLSSDIEMGDAEDEDDEEEEDDEAVRRTRRTRKMPARYTR
ncbi:hypothetical protein SBOR_9846 [Sclerotinia borealis F-4128]|uniref:SET domain-containing protein n=1 Tax=Sclerotinia borealis (strain F-4128) TaxID=1432307 RepID=W9C4C8_SCLBF|nr:hypothetical protein SBOR_9846 [Sclerotinia borealis F-4128]